MAHVFSTSASRLTVGSQTAAGITNPQKLPYEKSLFGGLSILNGPVQIGVAPLLPVPKGVLDIGPSVPTSGPVALSAVHIIHPVKGIKLTSTAIGFEVAAPTNSVIGNINITGNVVQTGNQTITGNITGSGTCAFPTFQGSINVQGWKGFDIKHPNKKGHRLRHVCVEGPEASVYVRGTLKGSNIIELPEYWKGLVDPESITVTLTPVGSYQELYIKNIEWGQKVTVLNSTSGPIHCFYSVWASRIDGEPLIVEYEGEDPSSYPGNPEQFSISGYDYGRGVDNS
mgnify:CR=1 FL=1